MKLKVDTAIFSSSFFLSLINIQPLIGWEEGKLLHRCGQAA